MGSSFGDLVAGIGDMPRQWWVVALRGIAAIVFGILAFVLPVVTLSVLILLFGAYAFVDGVLAFYAAARSGGQHVWAALLEGLVGILAGLVAFFFPGLTALALLLVIAAWAIVTGILEVIVAVRMRRVIANEWAMVLSGAVSIVFGLLLVAQPGSGALALVWLIGLYAVIFGVALLALAWRLREVYEHTHVSSPAARQTHVAA